MYNGRNLNSTIFDIALNLTEPYYNDTTIYGDKETLYRGKPKLPSDYNNVNYINRSSLLDISKPLENQSDRVARAIYNSTIGNPTAEELAIINKNIPVGGVQYTGRSIQTPLPKYTTYKMPSPKELYDNLIFAMDNRLGVVSPTTKGTTYSLLGDGVETIDDRVTASNIGGRQKYYDVNKVQDKVEELQEAYNKAAKVMKKPLTVGQKATEFALKNPALMRTLGVAGKATGVAGLINSGLGAIEGMRGIGAGFVPTLTGFVLGPEGAVLAKQGTDLYKTPERRDSFNLNTPEEEAAYRATLRNRQYR